jgi:hypothetical protein
MLKFLKSADEFSYEVHFLEELESLARVMMVQQPSIPSTGLVKNNRNKHQNLSFGR